MNVLPPYDEFLLPLLRLLEGGEVWHISDLRKKLSQEFAFTEEQLRMVIPSGRHTIFNSRTGWARTYLKKAGLIESPARGQFRVTDRGRVVLSRNPSKLDKDDLMEFEEFQAFQSRSNKGKTKPDPGPDPGPSKVSPEEALSAAYESIRGLVEAELLERLLACDPFDFERYVVDLLLAMGYGGSRDDAGWVTPASGDGGIDGVIKEDELGLDMIYVQAKRWENTVSRPELQKFAGALQGKRAKKGVFITTSSFSREARDFSESIDVRIVLIDGPQFARLMFQHDVGVSPSEHYVVKKIDEDYFLDA